MHLDVKLKENTCTGEIQNYLKQPLLLYKVARLVLGKYGRVERLTKCSLVF